jgi:hypothetical protein
LLCGKPNRGGDDVEALCCWFKSSNGNTVKHLHAQGLYVAQQGLHQLAGVQTSFKRVFYQVCRVAKAKRVDLAVFAAKRFFRTGNAFQQRVEVAYVVVQLFRRQAIRAWNSS